MSRAERDPLTALGQATGGEVKQRNESWPRLAMGLVAATALAYVYLGMRPGGSTPVWVFTRGRDLISLSALALLAFAVVRSLLRRPFLRPGRIRGFLALVLVVGIAPLPFPYPSSHASSPSTVEFRLPVSGEWRVLWGGERGDENRVTLVAPDRCSALHLVREADLVRAMEGDRPAESEGWEAFGQALRAPAAGTVVALREGLADGDLVNPEGAPAGPEVFGNHLVLEVGPGQYLFLSHLREGSIRVAEGESVVAGQPLAEVGSSGFSRLTPLPHVALHLADSPLPGAGEGIPWRVSGYLSDGREVERGLPRGGFGEDGRPCGQLVEDPAAEPGGLGK